MKRDYNTWHTRKKYIDSVETNIYFHEREIWWCVLGANIGYEQDGKGGQFARPVVVLRKFNNHIFLAIPLTSKHKDNKFHFQLESSVNGYTRSAVLSQIRLIDSKRLLDKIEMLSISQFGGLKKAVIALLQ